jgi:hypothetical protein
VTERRDFIRLAALMLVLLVATGAVLFATQGGSDSESGSASGSQQQVDGIVMSVTPDRLVLRPATAGAQDMTFEIRPVDRDRFDVFHLQQHAADGLATRVTYTQEGATLYAVSAIDAPAPAGG